MRTRVPLCIAALVALVLSIGTSPDRPARAEVDDTIAIGCEFLVYTVDGDSEDALQPADVVSACDGLSAADVAGLASALGDEDATLERTDFAEIDLDANQIADLNSAATIPLGFPVTDEIYVIAFLDDDEVVTFDADAGVSVHVNDSAGGLSADGDTNAETCAGVGAAADDEDCDNSTPSTDDGDGVAVATIVDATADDDDTIGVDVEQADDPDVTSTESVQIQGLADEVGLTAVETVIGASDDAQACAEEADAFDAEGQVSDLEKTVVIATVTDNDGDEITRTGVLFEAAGAIVIDETENFEAPPSFDTGISVDFGSAGIAAFAVVCGAEEPGDGTVTATINQGTAGEEQATVDITVVGTAANLALVADPAAVDCNGVSSSTVTAIVTDDNGNPVADGTNVNFSVVALGTANPINAPTLNGAASSQITPLPDASPGGVSVIVTADNLAQASIRIDCVAPSPPQLTATPTSTNTATPTDTPTATPTNTPSPTPTPIPCAGDVNGDNRVTLKDLRDVVRAITKERYDRHADLDRDGDVDFDDAVIVIRSLNEDCRTQGSH
jgi:hypothetical protein